MEIKSELDFEKVAEKHYDNPQCFAFSEFEQDLKRFGHVAKLIEKYGTVNHQERLILNNIIILHNLFGRFTAAGLFYKTNQSNWQILKTFLGFLHYIPRDCSQFEIQDDLRILTILNNL